MEKLKAWDIWKSRPKYLDPIDYLAIAGLGGLSLLFFYWWWRE